MPEGALSGGRVDVHAHFAPDAYVAELRRIGNVPDHITEWSPAIGLEMMDRWGTAATVLSLTPPGIWFGDQAATNRMARSVNEALAEVVRAEPSRFGGLAVLPLPDLDAALVELEYALDVLDLDGVELFSNIAGVYLGDPRLDPLFDQLDRRGALVLVHPLDPPFEGPLDLPAYMVEYPLDTTRAAVNLLYSGTLERCPKVKIVLAHLGGAVPFLAYRIRSLTLRTDAYDAAVPRGPLEYLSRLYYDTGLSGFEPALRASLAFPGVERIVFGTDWPYAEVPPEATDPQPALREILSEAEAAAIESGNAAELIPRLNPEPSPTG